MNAACTERQLTHEEANKKSESDSQKLVLYAKSPPQTFCVQWLGTNKVISESFEINDSFAVDSVTRSINLQTKLTTLVSSTWSLDIRAFVGFDHKKLELTFSPCDVNKYFKSFHEGGAPFVCDGSLDHAWYELLNSQKPVQILVTRYNSVDCAVGYIENRYLHKSWTWSLDNDVETLFRKLPAKLQLNDRVFKAYVKAGLRIESVPKSRWSDSNAHLLYAQIQGNSSWYLAPLDLQQNEALTLQMTRYLWLSDGIIHTAWTLPPHVDDVYSDCLHNCLYRTGYTREEILTRVSICGDVLALHHHCQSSCAHDPEIVMAAFKSDTKLRILTLFRQLGRDVSIFSSLSMWSDKKFVLEVASHCGTAVQHASSVLADDFEIGLAAVSQDGKAYGHLSERLRGITEIVLRAASHGRRLDQVPLAVQTNKSLVLKLVSLDKRAFEGFVYSPNQAQLEQRVYDKRVFMHDQKFMIECVEANWRMAFYLPVKARTSSFAQVVRVAACKQFGNARCACFQYFTQPFDEQEHDFSS